MTRSSASIRTSEPAFRPHTSQWQRENMGRVEPMAPARGMSEMRQGLIVGWLIGFAIITGIVLKGFGL
jgi:hypothetical protein